MTANWMSLARRAGRAGRVQQHAEIHRRFRTGAPHRLLAQGDLCAARRGAASGARNAGGIAAKGTAHHRRALAEICRSLVGEMAKELAIEYAARTKRLLLSDLGLGRKARVAAVDMQVLQTQLRELGRLARGGEPSRE